MRTVPALAALLAVTSATAIAQQSFVPEEATIAGIHAAMRARTLTCRALVEHYLLRIDTYDKRGPALTAIVQINPNAAKEADAMDERFQATGLSGPLHCIPIAVKDNIETVGLQSANGSASMQGFVSDRDAFIVKRVKDAGAIVLAKTNMGEFAFSPFETKSSILGETKNPYAPDRVPAGSSGGTAAAVAANLSAVGLGTDTGNSIRGPSSHAALVGIRSTIGLTSRAGVIPFSFLADIAGPMARTVEDAAAILQVIVGEDPEDPMTARVRGRAIPNYAAALDRNGLAGTRIGILRDAYERQNADEEVLKVFMKAVDDLKTAGAEIIDPAVVERPDRTRVAGGGPCRGLKYEINEYLATRGQKAPVRNLDEIVASGKFDPSVAGRLKGMAVATPEGPASESCKAETAYREAFGAAVTMLMEDQKLDALVYPTWSNPPRLIGDSKSPAGDNSQVYSPTSGFPAITVPMGYTRETTLPAGITFFGRAWDEARLIKLAYAYEQATRHRRPPPSTPTVQ
jgi:Asp-tRNA(Asn)/Glu-tRNA(Gln) amidotransferase A subunit family amidase